MKKILLILLLGMLSFSCEKEKVRIDDIKGTMDLKDLSLPRLKAFLKGKWQFQYSVIHNFGGFKDTIRRDGPKNGYLIFSSQDSVILLNDTPNIIIREKLIYERSAIPGDPNGRKAYILKFGYDGYNYLSEWVADRLVNDTLVFVNYFMGEGFNSYHFTKK